MGEAIIAGLLRTGVVRPQDPRASEPRTDRRSELQSRYNVSLFADNVEAACNADVVILAVKPQMGSILALFWLVEAWRVGGLRQVVRVFAPVTLFLLLTLAVFGLWPLNMLKATQFTTYWNASLWPYSIPVGLVLTVAAIRRREPRYSMAASPCLSPHVLFHSWSGALITLVTSPPEMIAAVVGLWILVGMRALSVNV